MSIASRTAQLSRNVGLYGMTISRYAMAPFAAFFDGVMLFVAGFASLYGYHAFVLHTPTGAIDASSYAALMILSSVLFMAIGQSMGIYDSLESADTAPNMRRTFAIWFGVVALLSIVAFLAKIGIHFSRGSTIIFSLSGAAMLYVNRALWHRSFNWLVDNRILAARRVLVVRLQFAPQMRTDESRLSLSSNLRRTGFDVRQEVVLPMNAGAEALQQTIQTMREQVALRQIEEIFVEMEHRDLARLDEVADHLRILPVPVHLVLDPVTQSIAAQKLRNVGNYLVSEIQREPLSMLERAVKRLLDIFVAATALVLLSPLMLLVAIWIKLDSQGPVFFKQDRRGFSGNIFRIMKFRSMGVTENGPAITQASRNDPRVTKVGRFIRRTSIDELPQLWNVLKGEMSIVGPRPHAVAHDDYYSDFIAEYAFRHHTKPGLTGLAQVKGLRGETPEVADMRRRVESDITYINNWSIWQDIMIILRTALVLFGQSRAY